MMNLPMHIRKPSQQTDVLGEFSSWDFSSQAPSLHDDEFSLDSNSLLTTASADDDEQQPTTPQTSNTKIPVSVSGAVFSIDPILFRKLDQLPWSYHSGWGYSLDTSPDLFEILIRFIQKGDLPLLTDVSMSDKEELEPLAALLHLHELQNHLNKKGRPHLRAPAGFRLSRERSNKSSQSSTSTASLSSSSASSSSKQLATAATASLLLLTKVKRKTSRLLLLRRTSAQQPPTRRMSHTEMAALSERFQ